MSFFGQAFMQNALLAGTAIAIASGLIGYFVVLRSQVFTGDALSHVAFTGAIAALALGVDARIGLLSAGE
jgi:zinc/manganese transport system permease protein